jgi:ABC-type antimicrobial peptide transport system permease subunit
VKVNGLDAPSDQPTLYTPVSQLDLLAPAYGGEFRTRGLTLVVRTEVEPASLAKAIEDAVHRVDASVPVTDVLTMDEAVAVSLAPQRFNLFLLGSFATLALLLATIGIYSVLAYSVKRRTAEIGIRMAMGAQRRHVVGLVLREGLRLVLAGTAIGLAGAVALSRLLRGMVFGVGTADLPTFAAVAALLPVVAVGASYLPARRATGVDPAAALREE